MEAAVHFINSIIWSKALIFMCLAAGLYFSARTRFMQIRGFFEMCRLTVSGEKSDAGVSSFQALAMSMAGRMGIGNIAGVATAIAFGGPGAIFWMWVMGFLGASTSYIECTLAQIYKTKDAEGRYRGGPAYYIEKAMGLKWYAMAFALATIVAAGFLMPGVQANAIADSIVNACRGGALCGPLDGQVFGMEQVQAMKLGIGVAVALLLGVVIFGGVKRIASFAEIVVPFMAAGFILMAITIMVLNAERVPEMFGIIFDSAFGTHAAFGAMMGLAVEWGVKRGIYANEAGQGTAPHAAAASEVSHPAKQGYVQAFAVYFDTMMVCTSTAFLILAAGTYNVYSPEAGAAPIFQGLAGIAEGAGYAQAAVESVIPGFGAAFVAVAIFFFAFTTIMAYYYMAETNLTYLNNNAKRPLTVLVLRLGIIGMVIFGAVHNAQLAWALGDIGVGLMAWLNIVAILIVQKPAMIALRDYERQKKLGLDPTFDPVALGIKNADFWQKKQEAA
ncbi:MAG: alanine/glycine:cation symporter family protein [Stenotrophomonas sp.]|uniref:alanine/glycine:cation symporter family protein n=1 Tax=Stenotrophomonas TaxID=40323 RepID=UPI000C31C0A2|nr:MULTISPECIES: alanine/glycine:cation symporter family protein [Stenotrophomonas]MDX3932882.1 alanine/glycine:cation symporter family protein [Stenotrophomonas sp.]PKH73173.1 sodium:alanine symporter [Stenotrophomonas sp. Betaine-02u-23]PKH73610.1 sodium:alanine symporter [Stenotrophomonas sp. Betaine-02u-21]PKH94787.1 sodium:alanine symporter [Stenotrophomonas sp. Bg11-02]